MNLKSSILFISLSIFSTGYATDSSDPVEITRLIIDDYVKPSLFSYTIEVLNTGSSSIKSLYVKSEYSNFQAGRKLEFIPVLKNGESRKLMLKNFENPGNGNFIITTYIDSINNEPCESSTKYQLQLTTYDSGFVRHPIAETIISTEDAEGPSLISAMEMLAEDYPDVIQVCAHEDPEDPMYFAQAPAYASWHNEMSADECKSIFLNRRKTFNATETDAWDDLTSTCQTYLNRPAYMDVSMEADVAEDDRLVTLRGNVEYGMVCEGNHRLLFMITEPEAGPYYQANKYAGGAQGEMHGWENLPDPVMISHKNVLRSYIAATEYDALLEGPHNEGFAFDFTCNIDLDCLSGNDFNVIAIVENTGTGEAVNAYELKLRKHASTIMTKDIVQPASEEWYTATGIKTNAGASQPGIYIFRKNNNMLKIRK